VPLLLVATVLLAPLAAASKSEQSRETTSEEGDPRTKQEKQPQPAKARSMTAGSAIRAIPWMDRTYDFGEESTCTVSHGDYSVLDEEGQIAASVHIRAVTFGDINSDGQEEALVATAGSAGGVAVILGGYVYGLKDGAVVLVAVVEGGDRGEGGIESMKVEGGDVIVRRYQVDTSDVHDPAKYGSLSRPNRFEIERWHWDGSKLVRVGTRTIHRAPTPRVSPPRRGGR
jgi:hypothetical protein